MIAVVLPRVRAATRFADFGEIEIVQQRHSHGYSLVPFVAILTLSRAPRPATAATTTPRSLPPIPAPGPVSAPIPAPDRSLPRSLPSLRPSRSRSLRPSSSSSHLGLLSSFFTLPSTACCRLLSSSAISFWRFSSAAFSSMNFCGMPLALCMAETSRSQSSTMKASVLTSRKVRSCEWIPAPLLWIWSISRKLNIIATSTSSSTPRSSVTRSVIHGFSTSNLTSRRSTRRSSAGGYLGALDFFLTPAAEIPRLKGCLTCLLLDDIGPGGARASRCEVRNWQNSVSVHRAKSRGPSGGDFLVCCTRAYRARPSQRGARYEYRRDPIEDI